MSAIGQAGRRLQAAIARAGTARAAARAARDHLESALEALRAGVGDSSHPAATAAVADLESALGELDEADDLLARGSQAVGDYLAVLGLGGGSGARGGSPDPAPTSRPMEQRVAEARAQLGEGLEGVTARGIWLTGSGRSIPLSSGVDEWHLAVVRHAESLSGTLRRARGRARHVEMKFAMRMRREGLIDEVIVMDRSVCGTGAKDRVQPYTCDKMLKWFLPSGARLRVVEPDGTVRSYFGRGAE